MKVKIALMGVMYDMFDKPMYRDEKEEHTLTMKDVIMGSLLRSDPPKQGQELDADTKADYEKYDLYVRVKRSAAHAIVDEEELVLIKKQIEKFQTILIKGQCRDILKGADQVKEKEIKK